MSKLQDLNLQTTHVASTVYDSGPMTFTPNEVTYFDAPSTDNVVISIAPAAGTTITGVSSDQGLSWTQAAGTWNSSFLPMPAAPGQTVVNITITIPGRIHDPSFTVKSKKRG
ncbi:hypothetical protein [Enhygromyxa salina]|uniref:hypothetical protein n=1 Tax=Enhygromyxa salina TaxID=215803 RepID=UPI00069754B9|nr:hypothetical protein [Enhygromyxa salina]